MWTDHQPFRRSSNVKAFSRGAAPLVGALSLLAAFGPAARLAAQSKDEVPRLLIMPFRSNDKGLGAEAAE